MQLKYLSTIQQAADHVLAITAFAWSPNNEKLAVVTTDKVVLLFDKHGERKDKFKTKPADANNTSYVVQAMAFSPDSTKLAIAQTDNIVFVYRLGSVWGEKKSICNKFVQDVAVTSLAWPGSSSRGNEVLFGLADGWVKVGDVSTNRSARLYQQPSGCFVLALATSANGNHIVSSHSDGSLWRFNFPGSNERMGPQSQSGHQLANHSCPAYALSFGESIMAAGSDRKVTFYHPASGEALQTFDYGPDEDLREFTTAAISPGGDSLVVGGFNRLLVFGYNLRKGLWEEVGQKLVENMYSVTALAWRPDGSQVAVGSLCGAVDMYEACLKRSIYKGLFELTYTSKSSVIVRTLATNCSILLKSMHGYEILKVNIYPNQADKQHRYLVANTQETILLGDLQTCMLSEIPWQASSMERYLFDCDKVAMLYDAGELLLVEYGKSEVLACVRTEQVSAYQVSCMLQPQRGIRAESKLLAYLKDTLTISILDLLSNTVLCDLTHDSRIDWLELNPRGTHLLFRDKRRHLHLYNLSSTARHTLMTYCTYAQWVPMSDVVVAQSHSELCVWYTPDKPDQKQEYPISGSVIDIVRVGDSTTILVEEELTTVEYALDTMLIYVTSALEDRDFEGACAMLEKFEQVTPEVEAQWSLVAQQALQDNQLHIARRCYAALCDIAKADFLQEVMDLVEEEEAAGIEDAINNSVRVRAQLALLNKQWAVSEQLYLSMNCVDEALDMYTQAQKWPDAIHVAEIARPGAVAGMKQQYMDWLRSNDQQEDAGMLKEQEGQFQDAMQLYLQAGLPARAANMVLRNGTDIADHALLETICHKLKDAGVYEKAGKLYEMRGMAMEALACYRSGHRFLMARDLAASQFPGEVVKIEEEWGEWLVSQRQMDAAINHFIEAHQKQKAIDAALSSQQFAKAAPIIDSLPVKEAAPYCKKLAAHYEKTRNYAEAERYYIIGGNVGDAVNMYSRIGKFDQAKKVAVAHLSEGEISELLTRKAREMEAEGKLKEAERMFCDVQDYDAAVRMWKKHKQYDRMIWLLQQHKPEKLEQQHLELAREFEHDQKNFRLAEKHYCAGKAWKQAVKMYRTLGMWEDALRVAKVWGGPGASKQTAYVWAAQLEGEEGTGEGAALLKRMGLIDYAIDYATECGDFLYAERLVAATTNKAKLEEVHLKKAMYLEDEGNFAEAEKHFISAGKPREAIDMFIHQQDWDSAMQCAERHDPTAIQDIMTAQGKVLEDRGALDKAAANYLKAKKPELAIMMYRKNGMYDEALTIADNYMPSERQKIYLEAAKQQESSGGEMTEAQLKQKMLLLVQAGKHSEAIDAGLQIQQAMLPTTAKLAEWYQGVYTITRESCSHREFEVATTIANRLEDAELFEEAGRMHLLIDNRQGAVQSFCRGSLFEAAENAAASVPALLKFVRDAKSRSAAAPQRETSRAASAEAMMNVEEWAKTGNWPQVYRVVREQFPEQLGHWAAQHAKQAFKAQQYNEAASILITQSAEMTPARDELYLAIAHAVLALPKAQRSVQAEGDLREFLAALRTKAELDSAWAPEARQRIKRVFEAAHYTALANMSEEMAAANPSERSQWEERAAKQCTTLLRYLGIVPADRAFYEAGIAWQRCGRHGMAFVFLNRVLDIIEAMEDDTEIENSDFLGTDIAIPSGYELPRQHYIDAHTQEKVRDFVLDKSMDQSVDQSLAMRRCESCNAETYEGNLTCHRCGSVREACAVTGYPIPSAERVTGKGSDVAARRDDWNAYVERHQKCPITGTAQSPIY